MHNAYVNRWIGVGWRWKVQMEWDLPLQLPTLTSRPPSQTHTLSNILPHSSFYVIRTTIINWFPCNLDLQCMKSPLDQSSLHNGCKTFAFKMLIKQGSNTYHFWSLWYDLPQVGFEPQTRQTRSELLTILLPSLLYVCHLKYHSHLLYFTSSEEHSWPKCNMWTL